MHKVAILLCLVATACSQPDPPVLVAPDAGQRADGSVASGACDPGNVAATLLGVAHVVDVQQRDCGDYVEGDALCLSGSIRVPVIPGDGASGTLDNAFHLVHRSCGLPTVVDTTGYAMAPVFFTGELAEYFDVNWLEFEHRYQGTRHRVMSIGSGTGSRSQPGRTTCTCLLAF